MKGLMKTALAAACLAGGLGSIGCHGGGERLSNCIDPCHMERYGAAARQEVITAFTPQVQNGRILDQTIWNYQFEAGTDKLTAGGQDKLDQIVRRRPQPDPRVFLATARDISFAADRPDDYADARRELDVKRTVAVQKYLAAQTAGRPIPFEVLVHDPSDPGMAGVSARNAITSQRGNYTGGAATSTSITSGGVTVTNQQPPGQTGTPAGATSPGGTPR